MGTHTLTLPIDSYLDEIVREVKESPLVLVQAEPGSGKTTRLPARLAALGDGDVWVLEPRRLAAILAAQHVAEQMDEGCGETVGYRVRYESKISQKTRLTYMTEGMFLRLVHDEALFRKVKYLILDEFHERHIQTDIALVLGRRLQAIRSDLKLVVMSATLDIETVEKTYDQVKTFRIPGRTFPVKRHYFDQLTANRVTDTIAAVRQMISDPEVDGNILVFLPGSAEIFAVCSGLAVLPGWEVLPLTATLTQKERQAIFQESDHRKVIVSTNVAESSVTLPNIGGVIDTGVAKIAGFAPWSGMPTLEIKRIPQASCIQREGRAGRSGPGKCYRLYGESDYLSREEFLSPEIDRLDLSAFVLDLAALGSQFGMDKPLAIDSWPWLTVPKPSLWQRACELLVNLGGLDQEGITPLGQNMRQWAFSPRLSVVVEKSIEVQCGYVGLAAACVLSEGGLLRRSQPVKIEDSCDIAYQLNIWRRNPNDSRLHGPAVKRFEMVLRQSLSQLPKDQPRDTDFSQIGTLLLHGFSDRVAKRRVAKQSTKGRAPKITYNFCLGRGGWLSHFSCVRQHEYLIALEATEDPSQRDASQGVMIQVASGITRQQLLEAKTPLLDTKVILEWNERGSRVEAVEQCVYGQLVLSRKSLELAIDGESILASKVLEQWPRPFPSSDALSDFNNRVRVLLSVNQNADIALIESDLFELFVQMICHGKSSFKEIQTKSLREYIEEQVSYEELALVDSLAPLQLRLSNGQKQRLHYNHDGTVVVSGRVQDFYGVDEVLTILEGRVIVGVELLGPHGRIVQKTLDLPKFWREGYADLAKEMRGRYPKHHWPEHPETSDPIRTKSRLPK